MAEEGPRSVAEKLAAARKKHKAYLKEKGLKNNNGIKVRDLQPEGDSSMPSSNTNMGFMEEQALVSESADICSDKPNHDNISDATQHNSLTSDLHEADFPLPQYSMDYSNQHPNTSLPDPLSFFDNFSNVGVTFQNFTQPLASFFNNSNNNPSNNEDIMELPNQILIEEQALCPVNFDSGKNVNINHNSQNNENLQQVFSYDKFKINAVNNKPVDNNRSIESGNNRTKQISEHQIFDQFTNSNNIVNNFPNQDYNSYNSENFPVTFQNNLEADAYKKGLGDNPYIFQSTKEIDMFKTNQIQIPTMCDLEAYSNTENLYVVNNVKNETEKILTSELPNCKKVEELMKEESLPYSSSIDTNDSKNKMKEQNLPYLSSIDINDDKGNCKEELSNVLDQQNSKCAQLELQLQESELKYAKLLADYRTLEIQNEERVAIPRSKVDDEVHAELSKLREDLQSHLQTIGMLVGEKTELSSLLNETQSAFQNQSSQCIELQNKMRELQSSYSDLEHELAGLKSEKLNQNMTQQEQANLFNKMQVDYNEIKNRFDELMQDQLELREKLKTTTDSNLNMHKQVQDLSGQLSLANIKIQQLTLGEVTQDNQVEKLIQEKLSYEKQITVLNDTLKTVTKEREDSNLQYQQYAEQLNAQIMNLGTKLEQLQRDNEQLRIQEENRVRHIGDLERQLQNVQSDGNSFNLQKNNSILKRELEVTADLAKNLQTEKDELGANLNKVLIEKELLEKQLEGYKFSISQLEMTVEQLKGSQPDNTVLLATMESDKVAASRAISQNNELKKQMEGMQEVLLKVNNDNVQLTENTALEKKINKELLEKLQKTEISLQTLAEAIDIKDKELVNLRGELERMGNRLMQQEQLSDRLRHYEAQDHSSPSLQNELQDAKQMIAHLTNELNILKKNQLNQTNQMNQTNQIDLTNQNTQTNKNQIEHDETDGSENTDILNELKTQLSNLQIRNKELESMLQNIHSTETKSTDTNGNESLDKETAMKHLEVKFLKTMEEIAKVTEEKQRLEHLVLQLQGETETIGEYVTLYQQQRSILKQKALEKDQQLQQLTNDRECIKANLDRLNNLVNKLIVEKGAITKELLEQHEHFSKERDDLCAEHQKIHQEINKITSDSLKNTGVSDNTNTEIAEEIITLLSEIKSSNLVQPAESIHHCPWCSGKLITV